MFQFLLFGQKYWKYPSCPQAKQTFWGFELFLMPLYPWCGLLNISEFFVREGGGIPKLFLFIFIFLLICFTNCFVDFLSMMLLFTSYLILFPLSLNSETVELLICLAASSVVLLTNRVLFKLSRTVCSIVLTTVVVISAMISFFVWASILIICKAELVCRCVLCDARTEREVIANCNKPIFSDAWRMRCHYCVNETAGKQFPTYHGPLEI